MLFSIEYIVFGKAYKVYCILARMFYTKNRMNEDATREELASFLKGGKAFMPFAEAVSDFPQKSINTRPQNVEYTFWHLLEHIRISQRDIIDFITNPGYKEYL